MSASWKASVPTRVEPTWPVIATSGTESMYASVIGVTRFVAPGPEVAVHTPARPVTFAYPSAMCPAPCSWRTRKVRMSGSSWRASNRGITGPPGSPKIAFTPARFSAARVASTARICAPYPVVLAGRPSVMDTAGGVPRPEES